MDAKWIGYISYKNYLNIDKGDLFGGTAQYYRKSFSLKQKPVKAVLKASALGIFKVFINGQSAADELFAPGWTNYNKRILYRVYDVTTLLAEENGLSFCVGDGWYAGYLSIKGRNIYGKYPLAIWAELECTFSDGSVERVVTDESWLAGEGAVRQNDFLCGEIYDDRLLHSETSAVDFNSKGWNNVFLCEDKTNLLSFCDYEPIVLKESFNAKLICKNGNSVIYDFGQNFAGVVTIKAKGESGSKITVRHAEILTENNTLYVENLRLAKATDTLILSGREIEYTPTFTYHGFRYIEVTMEDGAELISVIGRALYNDLKVTGEITTDNELVNQIISNVKWGMKSNFVDVPTDCPQRNERLGWTADTQVFSRTASYFADCNKFYSKYLTCLDDDRIGGSIPDIIPCFGVGGFDRAFWRDAAVVLPFNLYEMYGENAKIEKYLLIIKDFLDRQISIAENYIWKVCHYNDWLNVDENSPEDVLATAINVNCFNMAIKLLLTFGENCTIYQDFLSKVVSCFEEKFIDKKGKIRGGTQTLYAIAYRAGLVTKTQAKNGLIECFERRNNHIHSGFCGIRFILPVLCDLGLDELAYELIIKETFPSWGYSIKNGATTMWERWDSYVVGKGVSDPVMNSFNHYSFGSCGEWFFEYMLGVKPTEAGFKKIKVQPYVDKSGKVKKASGSFDSVNGKISVSWQKIERGFSCNIDKPQNIPAEFRFEGVTKIIQDGVIVNEFSPFAIRTEVYFNPENLKN